MEQDTSKYLSMLKEATQKSKCSLCRSEAYGNGCIYSARGIHLHMDDPKKCGWCGSSTIVGPGCIYSPTKYHGVGANLYTSMVAECFIASFLLNKLKTPYNETNAYRYGVISEDGSLIKKPSTKDEKKAYTILDSFIFKVKSYLGPKLDLIRENMLLDLSQKLIHEKTSVDDFEKELQLKKKLTHLSNEFYDIIAKAEQENLSSPIIEKSIIESFLHDKP